MELSSASVSRTSSFRKRALEERKSLDMEIESLPTKHERAPSEADMDISSSPAKFSNTVMDEIEAHFQRSLAQPKQSHSSVGPPSTVPTSSHATPPQTHRPLVINSHPSHEKHPRVTVSPSTSHTPSHPSDNDSHQIVVTLNNHAVSPNNSRKSPTQKKPLSNGARTHIPIKPVPKTGPASFVAAPAGFVTIPQTGPTAFVAPQNLPKISPPPKGSSPVSSTIQTLPMLTIPPGGLVNTESGVKNVSGGTVLSPVLNPQLVQFQNLMLTQQNLAFLQQQQEQQKRQQLLNSSQRKENLSSPVPNQTPGFVQMPAAIPSSPGGLQIIDLTKVGLVAQNQRSSQGQSSPKLPTTHQNVVLVQKDGSPIVTKGLGTAGGTLMVVNPSGIPVQQSLNKAANKAASTVVSATTTQPTPAVATTLLSSPQIMSGQGLSPMVMPMIDPTTSQIVSGGNQVVFLSAPSSLPVVQQQPLVLVNPGDLSTLQQVPSGIPPAMNLLSPGYTAVPNPSGGGGFILLSPGPNSTSFVPPLVNMTTPSGAPSPTATPQRNSSPSQLKRAPPPLKAAQKPKVPPLEPVAMRRTSLDSISPGEEEGDDVMMTPASVEDHFAKALGDQWSKLQTEADFRSSLPRSAQTAQT